MISWLQSHVWLCTYVLAGCAAITLLIKLLSKSSRSKSGQTINKSKNSTINQAGGSITINHNNNER